MQDMNCKYIQRFSYYFCLFIYQFNHLVTHPIKFLISSFVCSLWILSLYIIIIFSNYLIIHPFTSIFLHFFCIDSFLMNYSLEIFTFSLLFSNISIVYWLIWSLIYLLSYLFEYHRSTYIYYKL